MINKPKIYGFIPARMDSSRFYGKPLHNIKGIPMIGHVIRRAEMYQNWSGLFLTTCDEQIKIFGDSIKIPTIMTSSHHTRALDRISEAVTLLDHKIDDHDIIVNVQGDEPMFVPEMIDAVVNPIIENSDVDGTVLAMDIVNEEQFNDPNALKIIYDLNGDILYTSRSPVPYCEKFSENLEAKRIYGIFGFTWAFLKLFTSLKESRLEKLESCDSNRLYDNGYKQRIAPFPYFNSFSVDVPEDAILVEKYIEADPLYFSYKDSF